MILGLLKLTIKISHPVGSVASNSPIPKPSGLQNGRGREPKGLGYVMMGTSKDMIVRREKYLSESTLP